MREKSLIRRRLERQSGKRRAGVGAGEQSRVYRCSLPTAALLSGNEHMRDQQLQDGVTAEEEGGRSKARPRH